MARLRGLGRFLLTTLAVATAMGVTGEASAAGIAASSIAPGVALVISPAWLFGVAISAPMVLLAGGVAAVMAADRMR